MKANQLSQTAAFVAIKFYGLTHDEKYCSLFDTSIIRFYDDLVQSLPAPIRFYHYWLKFRWVRTVYIKSEELMLPGDLMHVIARKWYIQQLIDELRNDGYQQLIVLGAGFDHLAYYYSQRNMQCFEFDTPYMARRKVRFINTNYPRHKHPHIREAYLPADTLQSLFNNTSEIDPTLKTIIVAEGFFDYLDADTVNLSLKAIKNHFTTAAALVCTHFALNEFSSFHQWVFKSSVQMVGEKLQFESSMADFRKLLGDHNFTICREFNSDDITAGLLTRLGTSLPILPGFYVLKAQ